MARRNGGKVLVTDPDRLGDYVVSDYVNTRNSGLVNEFCKLKKVGSHPVRATPHFKNSW
jgi:hypothetical protein